MAGIFLYYPMKEVFYKLYSPSIELNMDELQREALHFFRQLVLVLPRLHLNFHLSHSISV